MGDNLLANPPPPPPPPLLFELLLDVDKPPFFRVGRTILSVWFREFDYWLKEVNDLPGQQSGCFCSFPATAQMTSGHGRRI